MSKENKNTPAFPLIDETGNYIQEGMTLRDYACVKFMSSVISNADTMRELTKQYKNQTGSNKIEFEDIISKLGLLYADSFLKQREL